MKIDPIHQFNIEPLFTIGQIGKHTIAFTNSSLYMFLTVAVISLLMIGGMAGRQLVPGRLQSIAEISYEFVAGTIRSTAGSEGMKFFPLIFSLFMFILLGNMIGLIPYTFTFTGQVVVTFALAIFVFLLVTIVAFIKHGLHFFTFFFPPGAPKVMAPILVPIEIISYLSRPISLGIRLFANMMAGHTMLEVFATFAVVLPWWGKIAPTGFMVAFTGLEVLVAFLQALIFAVLTCIYLNDAVNMHH